MQSNISHIGERILFRKTGNISTIIGETEKTYQLDSGRIAIKDKEYYTWKIINNNEEYFHNFYTKLTKKIKNDPRFINGNWELHLQKKSNNSVNLTNKTKLKTILQENYIMSDNGTEKFYSEGKKPMGLWTSGLYGNENTTQWTNWLASEQRNWGIPDKTSYYMINIDYSKIYTIYNITDARLFHEKYSRPGELGEKYISWEKLQNDGYGGVHITDPRNLYHSFMWMYTWDVTSTCIWDKKAILNIVKIDIDDILNSANNNNNISNTNYTGPLYNNNNNYNYNTDGILNELREWNPDKFRNYDPIKFRENFFKPKVKNNGKLYIYNIYINKNIVTPNYDGYITAVIIASTEKEARLIFNTEYNYQNIWLNKQKSTCKKIGISITNKKGVILASWA